MNVDTMVGQMNSIYFYGAGQYGSAAVELLKK